MLYGAIELIQEVLLLFSIPNNSDAALLRLPFSLVDDVFTSSFALLYDRKLPVC